METRRDIHYDKSFQLLSHLLSQQGFRYEWDREKNKLQGEIDGQTCHFRMPLTYPPPDACIELERYLVQVPVVPAPFLLILIQAGHSAIGYFEDGELSLHKVIKKYMVRGNGKAQVGYLQTRGKSKAGSRIRLANSISFFEDINEKLREWEVADQAVRILVSCPINMLSLWYESKVTPPFDREDPRILKVPMDIHKPGSEELERVGELAQRGRWDGPAGPIDAFFAKSRTSYSEE